MGVFQGALPAVCVAALVANSASARSALPSASLYRCVRSPRVHRLTVEFDVRLALNLSRCNSISVISHARRGAHMTTSHVLLRSTFHQFRGCQWTWSSTCELRLHRELPAAQRGRHGHMDCSSITQAIGTCIRAAVACNEH